MRDEVRLGMCLALGQRLGLHEMDVGIVLGGLLVRFLEG